MNKRIKELLVMAGVYECDVNDPEFVVPEEQKKFAELIIDDCIKCIEFQYGGGNLMDDGETHNPEWDRALECARAMIKHQFYPNDF